MTRTVPGSGVPRVVVVGGGLAGITAALAAMDAGCRVELLEARPVLGGLTHSFHRAGLHADLHVDNGQHVFLRCCTSYLRLLERLGTRDQVVIQPRMNVPVLRPGARPARLRRSDLPAPLHLARSLLTYSALPLADRVRIIPAALALRRVDADDQATDGQSFGAWLARHDQRAAALAALWDLVGVATLNTCAERASLAMAARVFQLGMLTRADAGDIGWARVPLRRLHGDPAQSILDTGAAVHLRTKAQEVRRGAGGFEVLTASGRHGADIVVLAVPPAAAAVLLPPDAVDLPAGWASLLGSSPIVNVHVLLDRRVLDEPFVAGVQTDVQWIFDRTAQAGFRDGQYLAVSLSAADRWIDLPSARIRELILPGLRVLLPQMRSARVREVFVTRERHATFLPSPGSGAWRPPARTKLPGLFLAGAWTATGWPATMEGAVRSGEAAVAAALDQAPGLVRDGVAAA